MIIPYREDVKLCIRHTEEYTNWWSDYVMGKKVTISYTSDCEACKIEHEARCPTCNKYLNH